MKNLERIGISIEQDLLASYDQMIQKKGYPNRSEAVRDLIREAISKQQLSRPQSRAIAGLFLVYDHHTTGLSSKLTELQHSHLLQVVSSVHIHLDHHNCLEIIILKGKIKDITAISDRIGGLKGVKLSRINLFTAEKEH